MRSRRSRLVWSAAAVVVSGRMKTFNELAFVSLSLLLAVACKPGAPPKAAGGGICDRRAGRPRARAAGRPQPGLQRRLREGRAQPAVERRAVEAGGRAHVRRQGRAVPRGHEPRAQPLGRAAAPPAHQAGEGAHVHDPVQGALDAEDARLPEAGSGGPAVPRVLEAAVRRRGRSRRSYSGTFTMDAPDDPGVEMAFHMGGQLARLTPAPFTVCLDDVARRRSAVHRGAGAGAAADPERAGQPGRLLPGPREDRDRQEPERRAVGAAGREGRGRRTRGRRSRSAPTRRRATRCRSSTSRRTPGRAPASRCAWAATSATRSTSATTSTAS